MGSQNKQLIVCLIGIGRIWKYLMFLSFQIIAINLIIYWINRIENPKRRLVVILMWTSTNEHYLLLFVICPYWPLLAQTFAGTHLCAVCR